MNECWAFISCLLCIHWHTLLFPYSIFSLIRWISLIFKYQTAVFVGSKASVIVMSLFSALWVLLCFVIFSSHMSDQLWVLFSVQREGKDPISFICKCSSSCPSTMSWKASSFPLDCLGTLVEASWLEIHGFYFWTSKYVPLISQSILWYCYVVLISSILKVFLK